MSNAFTSRHEIVDSIGKAVDQAYMAGYNAGHDEGMNYDKHYESGLNDAWECAKTIYSMSAGALIKTFGSCSNWVNYSASEAIRIIENYFKSDPINLVDEIILGAQRIEYGTDGNPYVLSMTNGKELEQEPCEDMVSRKEVLKQLKSCLTGGETEYNYVKMHIDSIPPVISKPKTGHWIQREYVDDSPDKCSKCGHLYTEYVCGWEWEKTGKLPNFCPNCGRKMLPTDSDCNSCKHQNEVDGSNCYECVKGIRNNYMADSEKEV